MNTSIMAWKESPLLGQDGAAIEKYNNKIEHHVIQP
jgi:hypothetical protein